MVLSEPVLYAIGVATTIAFNVMQLFFVVTLSDFECGYLRAEVCCAQLNRWIHVKTMGHTFLTYLMLLHGEWLLLLLNLPMLFWMIHLISSVVPGNDGVYDSTEIQHRAKFSKYMRDAIIHMGYYMVSFTIYTYCFAVVILK